MARKSMTLSNAFAAAMELTSADDRATLAQWLGKATRAGLWLDAAGIRRDGEAALRELLDPPTSVVHVDFGLQARSEAPPLTDAEIRGLRDLFVHCPTAKRAYSRANGEAIG